MALFAAMSAALTPATIMLTPTQKLFSFTLIPLAVGAILFGPEAALLLGFVSDTVNYLIKPMGVYFPGYAVSLAVSCLIFALWQYKKPLRLWRLACAQVCNIIIVYFGLNLLWATMFLDRTAATVVNLTKLAINAGSFPVVVGLVYGLAKLSIKLESRYVKKSTGENGR